MPLRGIAVRRRRMPRSGIASPYKKTFKSIIKESLSDIIESSCPTDFGMDAPRIDVKGDFVRPVADGAQMVVEIADDSGIIHVDALHGDIFFGAHIDINFGPDVEVRIPMFKTAKICPHDAWRDRSDAPDDVGAFASAKERHESAQGGTDEGSILRSFERAVVRIHEGDEEFGEIVEKFSPARIEDTGGGVCPRSIFGESVDFVINGTDNPFALEAPIGSHVIERAIDAPRIETCAFGMRKDVLSVRHVDDGIGALGTLVVGIGQIDSNRAFEFIER